jgi:hypothetical protein
MLLARNHLGCYDIQRRLIIHCQAERVGTWARGDPNHSNLSWLKHHNSVS